MRLTRRRAPARARREALAARRQGSPRRGAPIPRASAIAARRVPARLLASRRLRAATEACRVVVVAVSMRDRAVCAAVAVLGRVEPVAPLERAVRVGGPFVEVADHVVDSFV